MKTFRSDLSQNEFPIAEKVSGKTIRASLLAFIQKSNPYFSVNNSLSVRELNTIREKYISDYLANEIGELTALEKKVIAAITDKSSISEKLDEKNIVPLTLGQRVADKVAAFGGSWTFIISFGVFLVIWILINVLWFANKGFDPYPFILLNLILSCIAALQAPVIMMSQNRQEEKDRERSKQDYIINLKAELEIRTLHEKIDHLIINQQQELVEMQKMQIEMLNDILNQLSQKK